MAKPKLTEKDFARSARALAERRVEILRQLGDIAKLAMSSARTIQPG